MTAGLATAVAAFGLRDTRPTLVDRALDAAAWQRLLDVAVDQRITGLLVEAIGSGAFATSDEQQHEALARHESMLGFDLLLERLLLDRTARLEDAAIPYRVLKGPALAHTIYGDPSLRSFRDIDLLVAEKHYDAAIGVLCSEGGRSRFIEPRAGFNRRFGKGVCVEMPDRQQIDVHRTLVTGPFGFAIDSGALFASNADFMLGGRRLQGLDPEARFVHACIHACLGDDPPRLVPLRDVAQMVLHSRLDVRRVVTLCERWRCGIVVQRALSTAWTAFGIASAPELVTRARSYRPSTFERWALSAHLENRSYARQAVAGLWAISGWRAKVAYARMLLMPNADYVREHDGSYARRARRGLRALVDLLPGRPRPEGPG